MNQLTPSSPLVNSSPSSEALVVSSMSSAMSRTCKSGAMRSCYRVGEAIRNSDPPRRACKSIAVFFGLAIVAPMTSMKAVTPPRAIASAWNLKLTN